MVVILEGVEGQVERVQAIIDKHDSKVTRLGIKRSPLPPVSWSPGARFNEVK
jgi:hypothetical protein